MRDLYSACFITGFYILKHLLLYQYHKYTEQTLLTANLAYRLYTSLAVNVADLFVIHQNQHVAKSLMTEKTGGYRRVDRYNSADLGALSQISQSIATLSDLWAYLEGGAGAAPPLAQGQKFFALFK